MNILDINRLKFYNFNQEVTTQVAVTPDPSPAA
jgi:hypothetical protein